MNHEDSQMIDILETIADRLLDIHLLYNRRFDELAAQIESRLPAKVGEQLSLLAIVTAPEAVVPNEDEAMPVVDARPPIVADPSWEVLASCPSCTTKAYTEKGVEEMFGYRTPAGRKTIVQSWCRYCRTDGKDKTEPVVELVIVQDEPSPRKKQRLPDDVRDQGMLGRHLLKMAAAKRDERAMVLEASSGRETKDSLALLREEQDLTTKGMAELSGYDTKRAIIRKTNGHK